MEAKVGFANTVTRVCTRVQQCYREVLFPAIVIGATLFYIAYYLRAGIVGPELALEWKKPFLLIMAVHCVVLFEKMLQKKPIELRILLLNVGWMFLSRCIIGNYTLEFNDACFWAVLMCLMFASSMSLENGRRRLLVTLVTLELVGVTALWAFVAVLTVVNNQPVSGFEGIALHPPRFSPEVQHIKFYTLNRNITALYFLIAVGLLLYQCFRTAQLSWRIITGFYAPLAFAGIALQRSDTVYVAFAILISTAVVVVYGRDSCARSPIKRAVVRALAWILCAVLIYVGLDGSMKLVQNRANAEEFSPIPTEAPYTMATGLVANVIKQANNPYPYARETWYGALSFNGRTEIWAATIPTLKESPKSTVVGTREQTAMDAINAHIVRIDGGASAYVHMHNVILQQLVIAGIPGMIAYVFLICILLWKCLRAYSNLRLQNAGSKSRQMLATLLIVLLLYGTMEPLLSPFIPISTLYFCLVAGVFVAGKTDLHTK